MNPKEVLSSQAAQTSCSQSKPPVESDGGSASAPSPHVTSISSVSVSSTVAPRWNTSQSRKQFDLAGCPSIVTFYISQPSSQHSPESLSGPTSLAVEPELTCTKTVPPVPLEGFPAKLRATIVVVELKAGLKNEICGKNGDESRYCFVAGTGYKPARKKTT